MRLMMTRVAAFSASNLEAFAWSFASFLRRSLASLASAVEEIVREAVLDSRASIAKVSDLKIGWGRRRWIIEMVEAGEGEEGSEEGMDADQRNRVCYIDLHVQMRATPYTSSTIPQIHSTKVNIHLLKKSMLKGSVLQVEKCILRSRLFP